MDAAGFRGFTKHIDPVSLSSGVRNLDAPRLADAIECHSGAKPKSTSTQAAMSDERPIPARQCTATAFPSFRRVTIASASGHATVRERESTELHINVMAKSGFPIKAKFPDLLGSRRLTMTPIPSALQPAISSSSQSPARGCCMIAKRAPAGRSIQ
jgi:hypothetical protein